MKNAIILGLVAFVVLGAVGCQTVTTYAARGGLLAGEAAYFAGQDLDHKPLKASWLRPGLAQTGGERAAKYARIEHVDDRTLVDDWEHALLLDRPTMLSRSMTR